MSRPIITLTTDFGQTDGYVGAMKGVLLSICPEATLVDISHDIQPQAIRQAAYVLSTAAPYFPPGTVHVVVVDPGVGSERRAVVVQTQQALYVAPDNGVLSVALRQDPAQSAVHLTGPHYRLAQVTATFHGRDVFAPAAAYLACGTAPQQMGNAISVSSLTILPGSEPQRQPDGSWRGEILHVDRFGNVVTNFHPAQAYAPTAVVVRGRRIETLSHTFADVEPGGLVAYAGSSGYLEVAIREGNAAREMGLRVGDPIRVESAL